MKIPLYWMNETSGAVRDAVEAFLTARDMTPEQIEVMRVYLRQWIEAPVWQGGEIPALRKGIDELTTQGAIADWLDRAERVGIDPL